MYSSVFSANCSSSAPRLERATSSTSVIVRSVWRVPLATSSPSASELVAVDSDHLALVDPVEHVGAHTVEERDAGLREQQRARGSGSGPVIDSAALTTPAAPASIRLSAATRSRSWWSMTAISPGWSRLARSLVRRSTRAGPSTTTSLVGSRAWSRGTRPLRRSARRGGRQQLRGVLPGRGALGGSGQHAGQLHDPFVGLEVAGPGDGAIRPVVFVTVTWASAKAATCGRWVTTSTWWRRPRRPAPARPRCAASPPIPASTSSKTRRGRGRGEHEPQGEHGAGQLAARGHLGQRQGRRARVGGEQEARPRRPGRRLRPRPRRVARPWPARAGAPATARGEVGRRLPAGRADLLPRPRRGPRRPPRSACSSVGRGLLVALERVEPGRHVVAVGEDVGQRAARRRTVSVVAVPYLRRRSASSWRRSRSASRRSGSSSISSPRCWSVGREVVDLGDHRAEALRPRPRTGPGR